MSDCRKVRRVKVDHDWFVTRAHDKRCLLNEKNEYWPKPPKTVKERIKPYGLTRPKELQRLIFDIALDLILRDLIEYNYSFQFPLSQAGYIRAVDVTHPGKFKGWKPGQRHIELRVENFKFTDKFVLYKYLVILKDKELKNLVKKKLKYKHIYPPPQ